MNASDGHGRGRSLTGAGWPTRSHLAAVMALVVGVLVLNISQHSFLTDDAFISFRYARHLAAGDGPTWNPGERIEGYTNFLWVVLMAGVIRLGLPPEVIANLVGISCSVSILILLPVFSARMSTSAGWLVIVPSLALALSRTFGAWSTGGLETMLFTLLISGAIWAAIEERRHDAQVPLLSAGLIVLAALTRPEGLLFGTVIGLWRLIGDARDGRGVTPSLRWVAVVTAGAAAHLAWRRAYYGTWVPNTFVAKVPAAWWDHGLLYLWDFTRGYGLPLLAPLAAFALWRRPDWDRVLVAACAATYAVYVVAIGGDRFEFRFWVPILPMSYWLVVDAIDRLGWSRGSAAVAVIALLAWTVHGSLQAETAQIPMQRGVNTLSSIKAYAVQRIDEGQRLRAAAAKGIIPSEPILAVSGAGAVPYYTDWPTVDRLGLNDRYIARLPIAVRGIIAHEHEAPLEYLRNRRVMIDDALNRLLFEHSALATLPAAVPRGSEHLPLHVVDVGDDRYLVFASFVPESELRRHFPTIVR